jgi:ABC-type antimicrobial peptide transport system permease subunit
VAIVSEAFARKFNLGANPVGRRMAEGGGRELDIEIVGLAKDAKYSEVKQPAPPVFYTPYRQQERVRALNFVVRTSGEADAVIGQIPTVMARIDPTLPVSNLRTMTQQVRDNTFEDRIVTTMAAIFAGLATILAAVGLYGVLAYTVAQRTREIGLRMALGADATQIRGLVLGQVAHMTIVGGVIGLGLAILAGSFMESLLYEMQGHDPVVMGSAAIFLTLIAFAAGFIPAYRASRVDPMLALRYE